MRLKLVCQARFDFDRGIVCRAVLILRSRLLSRITPRSRGSGLFRPVGITRQGRASVVELSIHT